MGKIILLVDYENIQNIDPSLIQEKDIEIKIFVGQSQNKLPFGLVQSMQRFGSAVEWIKIEGNGADSLDFHIAFYLGQLSKIDAGFSFIILSKDKGFDPLIQHLCRQNIDCRRIQDLLKLYKEDKITSQDEDLTTKVVDKLSAIEKNKRPRNRKTLCKYIKSFLSKRNLSEQELDALTNILFIQKKVSEVSNSITYNF